MNAVLGFAQLLRRDPAVTPGQVEHVGAIMRSGEHLLTLIDEILEIAKIEAGTIPLRAGTFDLHALLHDIDALFQLRAGAKGLRLRVEQGEGLPAVVVADEAKLRQVLTNLVGNAVKFTAQGGVVVRVKPVMSGADVRVLVEVEDTGVGIAAEEMPRLFRKFEQTESGRRSHEGTGLGLVISKEYVELMGGTLRVTSKPGEGSVFSFDLPLREGDPRDLGAPIPRRRVSALAPGQPSYRVLVADDKDDNRRLLASLLGAVGFEVRLAADGEEAVAAFEAWRPHLVLMDMHMPGVDGADAIRRIRADPRGGAVKILCVSASAFDADRDCALEVGADAFLAKPFHEAVLFEKVRELLGVAYETTEIPAAAARAPGHEIPLTRAALRAFPADLQAELYQATLRADLDAVRELLLHADIHDADVARRLRELAQQYAYPRILDLLEGAPS